MLAITTSAFGQEKEVLNKAEVDAHNVTNYASAIQLADSLMAKYEANPFVVSADGGKTYWDGLGTIRDLYENALHYQPNDKYAVVQLSNLYQKMKMRSAQEHSAMLEKLIKRGDDYYNAEEFDKAKEAYQKVLNIDPTNVHCITRIKELEEW